MIWDIDKYNAGVSSKYSKCLYRPIFHCASQTSKEYVCTYTVNETQACSSRVNLFLITHSLTVQSFFIPF